MYAGANFKNAAYRLDENFNRDVWLVEAKPALKERNALMNLPYVLDGDTVVCQSNACLSYLGRKFDMWGSGNNEIIQCEELLCEVMDLRNGFVRFAYGSAVDPRDKEQAEKFISNVQGGILHKIELFLGRQSKFGADTPFLVGGHVTAPDFHLFEMLDQHKMVADFHGLTLLDESLPLLSSYYQWFSSLESMQKYLNSSLHAAPLNNLTAAFGSLTQGGKWEQGQPLPQDINGHY